MGFKKKNFIWFWSGFSKLFLLKNATKVTSVWRIIWFKIITDPVIFLSPSLHCVHTYPKVHLFRFHMSTCFACEALQKLQLFSKTVRDICMAISNDMDFFWFSSDFDGGFSKLFLTKKATKVSLFPRIKGQILWPSLSKNSFVSTFTC